MEHAVFLPSNVPPVVSVGWLRDRLRSRNIQIIDASWTATGSIESHQSAFVSERIPGAIFFNIGEIADPAPGPPNRMMPDPERFVEAASAVGLRRNARLIFMRVHCSLSGLLGLLASILLLTCAKKMDEAAEGARICKWSINQACKGGGSTMSDVLEAFIKHEYELKSYLSRFFSKPQDVEDVLQEAFIRAFATEVRTEVRSPRRLLFRAAKHAAINETQRKYNKTTDYLEDFDGSSVLIDNKQVAADNVLDGKEKLAAFIKAVGCLSPACREVFMLRKFEGLSHKEIAQRVGISVSGVEKHISAGTIKCSRYLREIGYDPTEFGAQKRRDNGKPLSDTVATCASKEHD